MADIFSKVKKMRPKSSNFNLSEESKLSMNIGDLVPILAKEVLPGDKMKLTTELLIKFAPLKAPMMHRLDAFVHYFFVPTFQINGVFEKFINPKVNTSASPIVLPYTAPKDISDSASGAFAPFGIGSLADYFGLPITQDSWKAQTKANGGYLLFDFFRAYQHIYNSYYRDQNMEPLEGADPTSSDLFLVDQYKDVTGYCGFNDQDSPIPVKQFRNLFTLRKRAWKKDYFTSALPSPQAGDDVFLPLGTSAPVAISSRNGIPLEFVPANGEAWDNVEQGDTDNVSLYPNVAGTSGILTPPDSDGLPNPQQAFVYNDGLEGEVDLTQATAVSVNQMRVAFALQRFKEAAERGGTRYPEYLQVHWDSFLPDWYIDRPIFLGGSKQPIAVGEVVQTSSNTDGSALGERAGIAQSYGRVKSAKLFAPCHGFLIGLLSIRPRATYQQGLERMWSRKSLYDFAHPEFANLGEQEILQQEIFATGTDADNKTVFGYTPRYAEYKHSHSHVCGEFRTSLGYWHMGRTFATAPTLSKDFIMMDNINYSPFNIVEGTDHVYVNLVNSIYARRKLPFFGTPKII